MPRDPRQPGQIKILSQLQRQGGTETDAGEDTRAAGAQTAAEPVASSTYARFHRSMNRELIGYSYFACVAAFPFLPLDYLAAR